MITLKELEIFFNICKNNHISNTAKSMNMTQSALSISLNSLEKKLDEKLFDRIGKKLILNERGRIFQKNAYFSFNNLKNLEQSFKSNKLKGELKIASSKTYNSLNLCLYIYDFIVNHDILIKKHSTNTTKIIDSILNSTIDIGFIENDFDNPNIIKEKLLDDSLIIVSKDVSLSKKEYFIDQLFNKKWILRESGSATREIFLNKIKDFNDMQINMEISNFHEIKEILLNRKDTITCISKYIVKKELEEKKLYEIKIKNLNFPRSLFVIYHKDKYKSKLFLKFLSHIKTNFKL